MSGRAEVIGCSPGLGLTIGPHMTPFGIDIQASSAFETAVATMQLPSKTSTATLRMALSIWDVTRLSAEPVAKMRFDFVLVAIGSLRFCVYHQMNVAISAITETIAMRSAEFIEVGSR